MGYPSTDLFVNDIIECSRNVCAPGQYLCYDQAYCIDIEQVCDGIGHCPHGDDESDCGVYLNFKFI